MYSRGVWEDVGRKKWESFRLCWTREHTRDLKGIGIKTMETNGIKLRIWSVNLHDHVRKCSIREYVAAILYLSHLEPLRKNIRPKQLA